MPSGLNGIAPPEPTNESSLIPRYSGGGELADTSLMRIMEDEPALRRAPEVDRKLGFPGNNCQWEHRHGFGTTCILPKQEEYQVLSEDYSTVAL